VVSAKNMEVQWLYTSQTEQKA